MERSRAGKRKKRKMRKWVKVVLWIIILLFAAAICYGAYSIYELNRAAKDSFEDLNRGGKSTLRDSKVTIDKDPISILLEGIEDYSTEGKNGRADTEIVVTLNPDTDQMTMVSIPRDTRVYMDKVPKSVKPGYHKINSAHVYGDIMGYGGNKLQIETIERLLDIPIDKYVAVDFEGFVDIVNTLGSVTIDVKEGFWEKNIFNDNKRIYFKAGTQKMNGEEALAFVRMRKRAVNSVYPRDQRQRQFVKATLHEAISAGTIFKIGKISDILGKHVRTNLKASGIYELEKIYSSMDTSSIKMLHITGENKMIGGLSYFVPDPNSLKKVTRKLKASLGLTDDSDKNNSTKN